MDFTHWAFVIMLFVSVFVLRSWQSILFVATLTLLSIIARLAMRNVCIITAVAERTSLPDISGRRVNVCFTVLFCAATLRLVLMLVIGDGYPIDQILTAAGVLSQNSDKASSLATASQTVSLFFR